MTATTEGYKLICIAPTVPSGASYNDPDEAIVAADAYHNVWDSATATWIDATCTEELEEARHRLSTKR